MAKVEPSKFLREANFDGILNFWGSTFFGGYKFLGIIIFGVPNL